MLQVSEQFYSLQGEGPTMGVPAVFLRLKGCNLTCGGPHTVQSKALENGATWRCDTIEVWTQGNNYTTEDLLEEWAQNGFLAHLKDGAHLIITGGEPLLQMPAIESFISTLSETLTFIPTIEIETNGTVTPSPKLKDVVSQWNISPKLSNSGMAKDKRFESEPLLTLKELPGAYFKFVISSEEDFSEVETDFIQTLDIKFSQIILMPGAFSKKDLLTLAPKVAEIAKNKGCRFSTRLQLELWDQATGV